MPSAYPSTRDLKRLAAAAKAALGEKARVVGVSFYTDGRVDFLTKEDETSDREAKLAVDEWEGLNGRPQNDVR